MTTIRPYTSTLIFTFVSLVTSKECGLVFGQFHLHRQLWLLDRVWNFLISRAIAIVSSSFRIRVEMENLYGVQVKIVFL